MKDLKTSDLMIVWCCKQCNRETIKIIVVMSYLKKKKFQ